MLHARLKCLSLFRTETVDRFSSLVNDGGGKLGTVELCLPRLPQTVDGTTGMEGATTSNICCGI